jgi:hypothetical protein
MVKELIIILTLRAYRVLKTKKGAGDETMSCNRMFIDNDNNAVALWWNNQPLNPYQLKQSSALITKLESFECTDYLILRICEDKEPESIGCFHDHPFTVKQIVTFEVSDGR